MADDVHTLTDIRVALGKIEVSTTNTERRVLNIEQDIKGFIGDAALEPLRARIAVLESFQTWVTRGAISAFATLILGLVYAARKLGIAP